MAWPSARVRDAVEYSSKRRAFVEFCSPPLREEMSERPRAICTPLAKRARVSARQRGQILGRTCHQRLRQLPRIGAMPTSVASLE
jgi:hypothetical protein